MSDVPAQTVRERLEARERATLHETAAFSDAATRPQPEPEDFYRTAFQRDRDRILHTKSFRRLKQKTQVFLAPKGDHYRTRLTHTLEVTQIARSVTRALFLNEDLAEAIGLGHDLGHTPFGHAGERVLDEVFEEGFRHYEQSLRVVDLLEHRQSAPGLNLTNEVREGILYHSQAKALLYGQRPELPRTLEAQIVSISDAIAYINHDIDDAVRGSIITLDDLPQDALNCLGRTSSARIDRMVRALIEGTSDGRLDMAAEVREAMVALRGYLYSEVYPSEGIEREISRARKVLRDLYFHFIEHPPQEVLEGRTEDSLPRRTVDYVAGMTDAYALRLYSELLLPEPW